MIGKVIAGKYRILDLKGSGGMAMVYRAQDIQTGEIVAIKVLKPEHMQDDEIVRRFEIEVKIASTYSHRNIVKTYETGQEDDMHYIVMEFIDGYTLQEYIHWKTRLDIDEAVDIGRKICDALFYAHSHQLIHRDVKPQNILLSRSGGVKIADFGIAKAATMETVTMGGSNALGSVHYISPEQARGGDIDEKADIYSMGVVLYEMVTGQVPFSGDTPVSVALKQVQEDPRPPRMLQPELPRSLEKIILKAMMKNPLARYDNAREMARDLEKAIAYPDGDYVVVKNIPDPEDTRAVPRVSPGYGQGTLSGTDGRRQDSAVRLGRMDNAPKPRRHGVAISIAVIGAVLLLTVGLLLLLQNYSQPNRVYSTLVPGVVDLPEVVAASQLSTAGLLYEVERIHNDSVEADRVISQLPEEGTTVLTGSIVKLVISLGSATQETPNLITLSAFEAREAAQAAGFKVDSIIYEESDRPPDQVIRQDPQAGVKRPVGTGITIYISKSSESSELTMVDLVGLAQEAAGSKIRDMLPGFEITRVNKINSSYAKGEVAQQQPTVGTVLEAGTEIIIWVSTGDMHLYGLTHTLTLDITKANTDVEIYFEDEDGITGTPQLVYQGTLSHGTHSVEPKLSSPTEGKKLLIVYYDGVEAFRTEVTLKDRIE